MGYKSKNIADIIEPKIVTLSASPNFVQFASKPVVKVYYEATVKVNITPAASNIATKTLFRLTEPSGVIHSFHGTTNALEVGGAIFFVSSDVTDTAENLRQAMLANRWINANFEIRIPSIWVDNDVDNGSTLNIKSKGAGQDFDITLAAPNNVGNVAYTINISNGDSTNGDSISGESSTAEIELDIYENPDVFLGADDRPLTTAKLGKYVTTMQKTYAGVPLWFELNALFSQYGTFNLPPVSAGWFDTGTARVYRFIAKLKNINSFTFYNSNALYVLNGYGPASENLDLTPYEFGQQKQKLLTNKPRTNYVRGQKAFLNFLFKDEERGQNVTNYTIRVAYQIYTTTGAPIATVYGQPRQRNDFNIVNTCVLDIDAAIAPYPNAGLVRVALEKGGAIFTESLEYVIVPECLHELTQFVFLNRLGGWDAFNFDNTITEDIKPTLETYNKTLTPAHKKGESLETVYSTSLANTFTVEGAPVSDEVAGWLKELAAARVVLDGGGNYVIKEDFVLRVSDATKNFHIPTIKYRLSETYTND